ncbi:MAG TPA: molybdopterin oxidoreductase, partial [Gammaproteobacteria bacterium]|nr:molybdopterin oxidoreductase [Gammaproteobacteria bacterium]
MTTIVYMPLKEKQLGFYLILAAFGVLVLVGLLAAWYMESNGHYVTGMNNQVVWGLPHVFAIFLIVAASGALNTASIASVFRKTVYKPLARYSALMAITLLIGGLTVLVLDLGRPDRLIIAMTHYNFTSIFAWNIILYTGLILVAVIYLWTMLEARMAGYNHQAGMAAFIWRIVLTTGTGSIFGFIIARSAFDAAILAPMFVVMSLGFGTACNLIGMLTLFPWNNRPLGEDLVHRFRKNLGIFVATNLYFVAVYHLTNLYFRNHQEAEQFILFTGNIYS